MVVIPSNAPAARTHLSEIAAGGASDSIAGLREIDAASLKALLDARRAVVVDVRESDEHAKERIAGSVLIPLSRFDPARVPMDSDETCVVLHCKSGRRSAEAAGRLLSGGRRSVVHLKGGIEGWKAAGQRVEGNARAPISIMRQVQITVGVLLLAATALAGLVSPWFLVVTGALGAGLTFAGATGFCGLAMVLGAMPWNRSLRPGASCAPK
jgi:rhodanese-related sulfurtransferase